MKNDIILGQKEVEELENEYENPTSFVELAETEVKEPEYIVDKLIVKGSITLIGAPRNSYKSIIAQDICVCISEGLPFLEKYVTKKSNVGYFSGEDSKNMFHNRLSMDLNGKNIILKNYNSVFLWSNLKVNKEEGLKELEKIIVENKIEVVVLDTLKRFNSLRENDSDSMSLLFTDILRPLAKKYGLTFILIHHTRKKPVGQDIVDKMDFLRGSGDIANNSDCIIMLERQGIEKFVLMSNERNKFGFENETIGIRFTFDNQNKEMKLDYVPESEWSVSQAPYYEKLALEWIRKEDLVKFKTKSLKDHFKSNNINFQDATINRVLESLELKHKIKKIKRGEWEVIREIQSDFKGVG